YRRLRSAGRRYDGCTRRQDPQPGGVSDRRQSRRARRLECAHHSSPGGGRMSFRVRPATGEDFRAIYQMAKLTGGGFTNLPADRDTLVAKLERSDRSFAREEDRQEGDL